MSVQFLLLTLYRSVAFLALVVLGVAVLSFLVVLLVIFVVRVRISRLLM